MKVTISSKPKLEVTAPKSPDEQTLKVKMPQGSTEGSKKLIAKQKQAAATAAGRFELLFQDKNTLTHPQWRWEKSCVDKNAVVRKRELGS